MKKLSTILGVFLFASLVLTSCGGPSACDCTKNAMKITTDEHDADLQKECEAHANSLDGEAKQKWQQEALECLSK